MYGQVYPMERIEPDILVGMSLDFRLETQKFDFSEFHDNFLDFFRNFLGRGAFFERFWTSQGKQGSRELANGGLKALGDA